MDDAETRKKVEATVVQMLKKADLREMTEFKLRVAASQELDIDLSSLQSKRLVRHLIESFLLSGSSLPGMGEVEVGSQEEVKPSLAEVAAKKEVNGGAPEEEGTFFKLSDRRFVVVRDLNGKNLVSSEDHYANHNQQPLSERGINLTPQHSPSFRSDVPEAKEATQKMEPKFRSRAVDENISNLSNSMDSITSGLVPIEINRFDGNNYHSWAQQMEFFLKQINTSYVLTDPRPTMNLTEGRSSLGIAQVKAAEQKWMNDDTICRRNILSCLSDNLFYKYSQRTSTARELWEQLKLVYLHEEFGSKRLQVKKYVEFQIGDSKPISEQVHELNQLADAVEAAGMSIDEKFHVSAIIAKLPPSWKDFSSKVMDKEKLSFQELMNQITLEEELQNQYKRKRPLEVQEVQPSKNVGLGASDPRVCRKRAEGEINDKSVICFNCGKKGHISRNCWSKKRE